MAGLVLKPMVELANIMQRSQHGQAVAGALREIRQTAKSRKPAAHHGQSNERLQGGRNISAVID
jgi:hypothetical protein